MEEFSVRSFMGYIYMGGDPLETEQVDADSSTFQISRIGTHKHMDTIASPSPSPSRSKPFRPDHCNTTASLVSN